MNTCRHEEQLVHTSIDTDGCLVDVVETRYTFVDIDLHRYKCTKCGKVMYYSEKARKLCEGETK